MISRSYYLLLLLMGICQGAVLAQNTTYKIVTHQKISNSNGGLKNILPLNAEFGSAVTCIGDLDHDGVDDLAATAALESTNGTDAGMVYILFMNKDNSVRSYNSFYISGASMLGSAVCPLGDLNKDGNSDIAVGAPGNDNNTGATYICFLKADGSLASSSLIGSGTTNFTSLSTGVKFGAALANVGDLDKDGVTDLLVTAPYEDNKKGAAYLIRLTASGGVASYKKLADGAAGIATGTLLAGGEFGTAATAAGDLNNNNITDIIITAANDSTGYTGAGAAFILYMDSTGSVDSLKRMDAQAKNMGGIIGTQTHFGTSIQYLEGYSSGKGPVIAIGALNAFDSRAETGMLYLMELSGSGDALRYKLIDNSAGGWSSPIPDGAHFGASVAAYGYKDHHSRPAYTFIAGATMLNDGNDAAGGLYVIQLADTTCDSSINRIAGYQLIANGKGNLGNPNKAGDYFGDGIANIGDLDHDGVNDLAVGADYNDNNGTNAGLVYILFMNKDMTVKKTNSFYVPNASRFGLRLCSLGDLDQDGNADLAVGSVAEDNFHGAVHICFLDNDGNLKSSKKIGKNTTGFATLSSGGIFGEDIDNIGDFNGDGVTDILVTAPYSQSNKGEVYIIYLTRSGGVAGYQKIADGVGGIPTNTIPSAAKFGTGAAKAGDLNRDGVTDLIVGAAYDNAKYTNGGAAYVLFMKSNGTVDHFTKLDGNNSTAAAFCANGTNFGLAAEYLSGFSLQKGPVVAVSAYNKAGTTDLKGVVYLLELDTSGNISRSVTVNDGAIGWAGPIAAGDRFGLSMAGMGYTGFENRPVYRMAVGAAGSDFGYTDAGAIHIFDLGDSTCFCDTSTIHPPVVKDTTVSISEDTFKHNSMRIYPNPATENIYIAVPLLTGSSQTYVTITDMQGRAMQQAVNWTHNSLESKCQLDLAKLRPGIYAISIASANSLYRAAFIRQ